MTEEAEEAARLVQVLRAFSAVGLPPLSTTFHFHAAASKLFPHSALVKRRECSVTYEFVFVWQEGEEVEGGRKGREMGMRKCVLERKARRSTMRLSLVNIERCTAPDSFVFTVSG